MRFRGSRLCLASAAVVASAGGAGAAAAHTRTAPTGVFRTDALLPGETLRGSLEVPAAPVGAAPFLRVEDVREGCADGCPGGAGAGPALAHELFLTVVAPDGSAWRGRISDLIDGITLPGGGIPGGAGRTYELALALQVSAAGVSDRTFGARLVWGSRDETGAPITVVEGETFAKPGADSQTGLPFTGDAIRALIGGGLLLLAGGMVFLLVGKARGRADVDY